MYRQKLWVRKRELSPCLLKLSFVLIKSLFQVLFWLNFPHLNFYVGGKLQLTHCATIVLAGLKNPANAPTWDQQTWTEGPRWSMITSTRVLKDCIEDFKVQTSFKVLVNAVECSPMIYLWKGKQWEAEIGWLADAVTCLRKSKERKRTWVSRSCGSWSRIWGRLEQKAWSHK